MLFRQWYGVQIFDLPKASKHKISKYFFTTLDTKMLEQYLLRFYIMLSQNIRLFMVRQYFIVSGRHQTTSLEVGLVPTGGQ